MSSAAEQKKAAAYMDHLMSGRHRFSSGGSYAPHLAPPSTTQPEHTMGGYLNDDHRPIMKFLSAVRRRKSKSPARRRKSPVRHRNSRVHRSSVLFRTN